MLRRKECENATQVELTKLTHDPMYSEADRIFGTVKQLQAQSVADACYDAKTSDKAGDIAKLSGDFALRERFLGTTLQPAPYTSAISPSMEATTLLSVILLGTAVVCFWRAAR
jgi:hypothetical protein